MVAGYPCLNWLNESMSLMEYPDETVNFITDVYKRVCENQRADQIFHAAVNIYSSNVMNEFYDLLVNSELSVEAILGEHKYVAHFLMILCLSQHTKELYKAKNLPDECFVGFLRDIKIKWAECLEVYGIQGVSTGPWFKRFIVATRMTFGRLEFDPQTYTFDDAVKIDGRSIQKGDLVIGVHIPSGGRLLKKDCEESFLKAAEYFAPIFPDGAVVFQCVSWLLYPEHKDFLPETSNILMFADFFKCTYSKPTGTDDLWRIFGSADLEDIPSLPENTSLQRAYKKRLLDGGEIGIGVGFFFVKNNKFIK